MTNTLHLSVSPHIHSGRSTMGIMRDVILSLCPAAIASRYSSLSTTVVRGEA